MISGLNHTGIVVRDLDAMVKFYTEELGLSVTARYESLSGDGVPHIGIPGAKRIAVFLGTDESDHQIELLSYLEPTSGEGHVARHQLGSAHICFEVDDLSARHKELAAKGVRFVTDPVFATTPDGSSWGVVYLQDPEGNWLELIEI